MSFSSEVKNELAHSLPERECCRLAEMAGFIRASGALKPAGQGGIGLLLSTGFPVVARHIKSLAETLCEDESVEISVSNTGGRVSSKRYALLLPASHTTTTLLENVGIISVRDGLISVPKSSPGSLTEHKHCRKAFLKGAFLGAGSVSDPNRAYSLEFVCGDDVFASDLRRIIHRFTDIRAGISRRGESYVVYLKSAEHVRDMLGIIGAARHLLAFENVRVLKEMKGKANRLSNCDNANVDRTLRAGTGQIEAVRRLLLFADGVDVLPPKLREVALLRLANPEATLTEIGAMANPPVGKSAVAARFERIAKYSHNVRKF